MEDPESVAKGICLRALTGTAKTRKQLADLLAKKDVPEEAAAAVLDRFTEVGLIDDAAFAAAWVSSRQSGRGLARRALPPSCAPRASTASWPPPRSPRSTRRTSGTPPAGWSSARCPSMSRLDRVTAERRLMGMLARKGYGGGLAGYVVREALDAAGAAEDAAAEAEDPFSDHGPAEDAPVWTPARSAARAAARSRHRARHPTDGRRGGRGPGPVDRAGPGWPRARSGRTTSPEPAAAPAARARVSGPERQIGRCDVVAPADLSFEVTSSALPSAGRASGCRTPVPASVVRAAGEPRSTRSGPGCPRTAPATIPALLRPLSGRARR